MLLSRLQRAPRPFLRGLAQSARQRDHYAALGVSRDASAPAVKKAYYALAKQHHPDASGDAERFAEINSAYEVLSDPSKRRLYDAYGDAGVDAAAAGGGGSARAAAPEDILREFGAFFTGGAGGARRARAADAPARGEDKQMAATLEFMEAARGAERKIRVGAMVKCGDCGGGGKVEGTRVQVCGECGGAGHVRGAPAGGMFGVVLMECGACGGAGEVLVDPCGSCGGSGVVSGVKEATVEFPPGTDEGMMLRVAATGDDGVRGGRAGDLYIRVRVKEDDYFHRDGRDLHVVAPVGVAQAALGGAVKVRTIDGEEEVRVPAGTQSDDTTTLRGRALKSVNGVRRGDQKVHFKVVVPSELNERQKEIFEELARLDGGSIERHGECEVPGLLQRFQRFLRTSVGGA